MARLGHMIADAPAVEGGQAARVKLIAFLTNLRRSADVEGMIEVTLYQSAKGSGMPVRTFELDIGEEIKDFVDGVVEEAEGDVEQYRGSTKYAIQASVGGRVIGREWFRLLVPKTRGELDGDPFDDDLDETVSTKGVLGQSMKHAEVFAKEMVKSAHLGRNFLERQNEKLLARIDSLEKQNAALLAERETVKSMEFARERELRKLDREDERREQTMLLLKQTLPLLASHMLPGAAPAINAMAAQQAQQNQTANTDGDLAMIAMRQSIILDGLIPTLSTEALMAIAPHLNDVQRAALQQLHQLVLEKQRIQNPARTENGSSASGYVPVDFNR